MADGLARVSGVVLFVETRSGVKVTEANPQGRAWTMRTANVLVADRDITKVTLGDGQEPPTKGEVVDWLVELRGGRFLNVDLVGEWKAFSDD